MALKNTQKKYGTNVRDVLVSMAKQSYGEYGKEVLSGDHNTLTTTPGTVFRQLHVLAETIFVSMIDSEAYCDGDGRDDQNNLCGVAIPANTMMYGSFSNIHIQSGLVICYKDGGAQVVSVIPRGRVSAPVASIIYPKEQDPILEITCATNGATILYTEYPDNLKERDNLNTYTEPVALTQSITYYIMAIKAGMMPSDVTVLNYMRPVIEQ